MMYNIYTVFNPFIISLHLSIKSTSAIYEFSQASKKELKQQAPLIFIPTHIFLIASPLITD